MESRFLAGVLAIGLIVIAFGLAIGLIRFPARVRAEYRPPFGQSAPVDCLRFDYYTDKGRILITRAACSAALLSFIFVAGGLLAAKFPSSGQPTHPSATALPPDTFFLAASAIFFTTALLSSLVLMLAAVIEFAWTIWKPSAQALRFNAARFAIYGAGAFLVAIAHVTLLRLGPTLLK
jgi:hypothetical protein